MPRNLVERAAQVTAFLDKVHGAPTHIGEASWIGVEDLHNPEFDDKPNIREGDVCMYWGCGTTATMAIINASMWRDSKPFKRLLPMISYDKIS